MHQFDQLVFAHGASRVSFHIQLRNQRAPARPGGEEEDGVVKVRRWEYQGPAQDKYVLLPAIGVLGRLLPDSVQLDVADVMVSEKAAATAPAYNHRGLEEVSSALLKRFLASKIIAHSQLPAHIQVPETNKAKGRQK